ncbi:DNA primase [Candidatus Woesebacteria bacterium RBG_16_41_13]|nr:MAG: DNA primase [Candidatus Woesebacteria bacterium RBG_16_41_13]
MDQVEEVKSKVDIVSLIGEYLQLTRAGRNFKGNCPFHQERTPSFMVSPELAIWKCFGCNLGGDVISFVEQIEGLEFREALKLLADRVGVKLRRSDDAKYNYKEKLVEINRFASDFYSYILLNHDLGKKALDYLTHDRLLHKTTVMEFGLGYAPESAQALFTFLTKKKQFKPVDIERAGVVVKVRGSYIDRFRGRVIFPLVDHRGLTVGLAGRILPSQDGGKLAKYINSPETEVYHKSRVLYAFNLTKKEIKKAGSVVVVEGELDAISSWQAGVKNVVAIKGSALTEDQAGLITRVADAAILALDSDVAGNMAARRGITIAENLGLSIKVARLGKYKDPDEAAREDPEFYKGALGKAVDVWDFLVDSVFDKHKHLGGRQTALISKEVLPILWAIPDEIVRAHYIKIVSMKLDVPESAVILELEKVTNIGKVSKEVAQNPVTDPLLVSREELLEKEIFSLAINFDPSLLVTKQNLALFKTPLWSRIAGYLAKYLKTSKKFALLKFAKSLPKELVDGFSSVVFVDSQLDENKLKRDFARAVRELRLLRIKQLEAGLVKKIAVFESSDEKTKLKRANEEFQKLSDERSVLEEE